MRTAWKIIRNVTKYISFLIFLGFTCFLLISYPLDISPGFLIPLLVCLILSLFYKFCHSKGDKTLVFILQLPWIFFLVSNIWWEPLRPPQFEENLNKGLKYYKGLGVQQDHKEAMKWFKLALVEEEYSRKSPAGGITSSESAFGITSSESAFMGDGGCFMSATNAEIEKRGRLGGRGLVQISENALGEIYEQGKDVQQNYEEAVKWYRRALSKAWSMSYQWQDCWKIMKYPKAHYNLGRMYDEGLGLPEDNHKAFLLLHAANYAWVMAMSPKDSEGFANTWHDDYGQYFYYLDIADHHSMEDAKHRMDLIAKELESYPGEMNANVELYLTDSSYFQRMLAEDKK